MHIFNLARISEKRNFVAILSLITASAGYLLCLAIWGNGFAAGFRSGLGLAFAAIWAIFSTFILLRDYAGNGLSIGFGLRSVAVSALFALVLTRGAPHNTPVLFQILERYGLAYLVLVGLLVLLTGIACGFALWRRYGRFSKTPEGPDQIDPISQMTFAICLASLSIFAMAAAADQVTLAWDQPGWGDSLFYDRIAHQIALGKIPMGHSYYMPLYQYGTAALYWLFGHFIFVQQLANLLLALATIVFLGMAGRLFFGSNTAGLVAAFLAASHDYLRYTPHTMTIENWYTPAMALALFLAARYLSQPTMWRLVALALGTGLVFAIRTQGAFFCAFLLLAPLFVKPLDLRRAVPKVILAGTIFAITMVPWTMRNYVYDGRLSPVGTQGGEHFAISGDPRGLYGIRRDLGYAEIYEEWKIRFPDEKERKSVMAQHGILLPITQPKMVWLEAVPWRFLAFYGLVPPGAWDKDGVRATDWAREGREYFLRIGPIAILLLVTVIAIISNPSRVVLYLFGGILANLAIIVFVGFSEARISYPVLTLHLLLATAATMPKARSSRFTDQAASQLGIPTASAGSSALFMLIGVVALGWVLTFSRNTLGRPFSYRALTESVKMYRDIALDSGLPDIGFAVRGAASDQLETERYPKVGERVRIRVVLTNQHHPVKYYAGTIDGFPAFTTDPKRETYYRVYLAGNDGRYDWGTSPYAGIAFEGAVANAQLNEEDFIEVEGIVMAYLDGRNLWVRARKVHLISRPQ